MRDLNAKVGRGREREISLGRLVLAKGLKEVRSELNDAKSANEL